MADFAQMQTALRVMHDRPDGLTGSKCPKGNCFGTLERVAGRLRCTGCSDRSSTTDAGGVPTIQLGPETPSQK